MTEFILRRWKFEDAEQLTEISNNENIARWLRDWFPHPYILEDAERYLSIAEMRGDRRCLMRAIVADEKVMNKIADGDFSLVVHHRKKDETIELADNMNKAIANVRETVIKDREKIGLINTAIDNNNKDEAKRLLSELLQWFKTEKAENDNV